jgi:hypothetical protein
MKPEPQEKSREEIKHRINCLGLYDNERGGLAPNDRRRH